MKDLEWFKDFYFQISVLFGFNVFTIQSYFVIESIASRLNAFIMGPLLKFLSVMKVLLANNYQLP